MAQTHKYVKKATSLHTLGVPVRIAYSATYFLCCLGAEFERTRVTPTPGTKDEFGLPMSFAEHPRAERGSRGLEDVRYFYGYLLSDLGLQANNLGFIWKFGLRAKG